MEGRTKGASEIECKYTVGGKVGGIVLAGMAVLWDRANE